MGSRMKLSPDYSPRRIAKALRLVSLRGFPVHAGVVPLYLELGKLSEPALLRMTQEAVFEKGIASRGNKHQNLSWSNAFLMWQREQERLHPAGEETSSNMYRRKLKAANSNKLIVFADSSFGIFLSHEVFMLAGVPVHDAEKVLKITREQIYTGIIPPDSS